jgi:RHH-type rel operon transcriptional repressor/antitoxin RelB
MTTVSVRLPDALAAKLEGVAREAERSKSFIIQKAVEAYLEDYADLRIALDRLRDPADAPIDGKSLRESLGL